MKQSNMLAEYIKESIEAKYEALKSGNSVKPVDSCVKLTNNIIEYKSSYKGADNAFTIACKKMFLQSNNHFKTLAYVLATYYKYVQKIFNDDIMRLEPELPKHKLKVKTNAKICKVSGRSQPCIKEALNNFEHIMKFELMHIEKLNQTVKKYCEALFYNKSGNIKTLNTFEREVLQYVLLYYGNNKTDVMKYLDITYHKFVRHLPEVKNL